MGKAAYMLIFWACAVAVSAYWNISDSSKNIQEHVVKMGRSYLGVVQAIRHWNASHGGVYVPVTGETLPNPYLKGPDRDVRTEEGRVLTKMNPAYMMRQASNIIEKTSGVKFHLTSENPLRPGNAPDEWERRALNSFEDGTREVMELVEHGNGWSYRYMTPLVVEEPCLACHAEQGYRLGDIRGGISVSFPSGGIQATYRSNVRHILLVHVAALLTGLGAIAWIVRVTLRARRDIEQERRLFKDLVELTDAIHWEVDIASLRFTYISPQVEDLLGYPTSAWTDFHFWVSTLHPEDAEWAPKFCNEQTAQGKDHVFAYRCLAADGRVVWLRDLVSVVMDEGGRPVKLRGLFVDITELKEAEDKQRQSIREKEVLLREVHHRVKNNMAVISSLLNMQSGYMKDEADREMMIECQGRIRAMALVHEKLYQGRNLSDIDVRDYVGSLVAGIRESEGSGPDVEIETEIEDLKLDLDTLIPCGIILNELVSNAYRHAFGGVERPEIRVSLKRHEGETLVLTVSDNGTGLGAGFDITAAEGLGLKIVHALAEQLGGRVDVDRDGGAMFRLTFPRQREFSGA